MPGGRAWWTLALYQIVKRDLLSTDPANPDLSEQVGKQSSRGIEWSGALQLGGGWSIDANAALLRARFDDFNEEQNGQSVSRAGNVPFNIPEQTANVWLDWAFAPGWKAGAGVQYVGRRFGDNANTVPIPSYTLIDASASWHAMRNLTLALYLRNLTNRVYAVSTQNDGSGMAARRTALGLGDRDDQFLNDILWVDQPMTSLQIDDLNWSPYDMRRRPHVVDLLRHIVLEARDGEFVGLIGPNGSGKTSLLRCAFRYAKPLHGR